MRLQRLGRDDAVQPHVLALGNPGQLGQPPEPRPQRPLLQSVLK